MYKLIAVKQSQRSIICILFKHMCTRRYIYLFPEIIGAVRIGVHHLAAWWRVVYWSSYIGVRVTLLETQTHVTY
jgi:hypothetical protein